jgi:hypothetical protein
MRKALIVSIVVVVLAGGVTAWWLTRDTAPPPMSVDDVSQKESTGPTTSDLDGTWTVEQGSDSQAGLRIVEAPCSCTRHGHPKVPEGQPVMWVR